MKMNMQEANDKQLFMAGLADYAYAYSPNFKVGKKIYENWSYFQPDNISEDVKCSAFCAVNEQKKEIVIIFKGSEPSPFDVPKFISDWCISDIRMLFGKTPLNFTDFIDYVSKIKSCFPEYKYFMSGHSLGGSIAQLIAVLECNKDIETYTFNAFGAEPLLKNIENENILINSSPDNIKNFIVDMDLVSERNKHIGSIYLIKYEKNLLKSILSIITEIPKVFSNFPYKVKSSVKSYFKFLDMAIKKIDAHLMNNFKNGFEYKSIDNNETI